MADSQDKPAITTRPRISDKELKLLEDSGVPAISLHDACKACDDPCYTDEDTHPDQTFGGRLALGQIDDEFPLLGSVKNSGRTVIVATSKSDWPHSVTDEQDLYAHAISKEYTAHLTDLEKDSTPTSSTSGAALNGAITNGQQGTNGQGITKIRHIVPGIDGLGDGLSKDGHERASNMSILCGSMHPYEEEHADGSEKRESVFIFPDYKMVSHLPSDSATELVSDHISPRLLVPQSAKPASELASYILPYHATILICSHKKRDKRCHITADPIISALSHAIEELGDTWHVDRRGDEAHLFESYRITPNDSEESIMDRKKQLIKSRDDARGSSSEEDKHIGIFKVSHVGGHKFAAQVIIWLPNGKSIWYGRVTTQDCKIIVNETLKHGRVVADLLRGGTALAGAGACKQQERGTLWDW